MKLRSLILYTLMCVCFVCLVTGCGPQRPKPGQYNIRLSSDNELCKRSIRVHLLGVNGYSQKAQWENKPVTEYWASGMTSVVPAYEIKFGLGVNCSYLLTKDDPIWAEWKANNADWLFVFADFPGDFSAYKGGNDPRKLAIPLDKKCWKSGLQSVKEIEIKLSPEGMILLNTPVPEMGCQ